MPFLQQPTPTAPQVRVLQLLVPAEGALTETLRTQIDAWSEANDVQVALRAADDLSATVREQLSGQSPPDLAVVSSFWFPSLATEGLLAPVPEDQLSPQGFPPRLLEAFTWNGSLYCLPREVRTLALVYDSIGLDAAGQLPPANWDELRVVAAEQTDLNIGRFGLIESPDLSRWLPFLHAAGGTVIDPNGQVVLESDAAAAALDLYIQLFRDNIAGHPGESNSGWAGEVLGKGKGGMAIEGNWVVPYFAQEFPRFHYGVAPLPTGPAGVNPSVAFTSCYGVSAGSQNQADAFALAAFLTSPAVIQALPNDGGWMPAQDDLRDQWVQRFPQLSPFSDAVPQAWVWQFPPGFELFLRSFNRGMVQLFAADIEAADLLSEMQRVGEGIVGNRE